MSKIKQIIKWLGCKMHDHCSKHGCTWFSETHFPGCISCYIEMVEAGRIEADPLLRFRKREGIGV